MAVDLEAKLSLDSRGFGGSLRKAGSQVESFGSKFTKLRGMIGAGLALGGITTALKEFTAAADEIDNLSTRLGIGTDEVQKFQLAADRTGQSMETVADAFKTLKVRSQEAAAGNEILQKQFEALGISQADLEGGNIEGMFDTLNSSLTNSPNRLEKLAVAMKLLGEPVERLVPILDEYNKTYDQVISQDNLTALDKLGDRSAKTWDNMKATAGNFAGWLVKNLGPALEPLGDPFGVGGTSVRTSNSTKDLEGSLKAIADEEKAAKKAEEDRKAREKKQKEIDKAKAGFEKAQRDNMMDRLSTEQKITKLKEEQLKLIADAEAASKAGKEVEFYEKMQEAAILSGQLQNLKGQGDPLGGLRVQQSSMQQAGARIAGVDKRIAQLAAGQLSVQKEILRHIREGSGVFTLNAAGGLNPYTGN